MNWQLDQDIPEKSTFVSGDKVFGHQSDGNARVWDRDAASDAAFDRLGIIYVETESELLAALDETQSLGQAYPFGPIIQLKRGTITLTDTITVSSRHSFVLRGFGNESSVLDASSIGNKPILVLERCTKATLSGFSMVSAAPPNNCTAAVVLKQTAAAGSIGLESEDCTLSRLSSRLCDATYHIDSTEETGDPQNGYHKFLECNSNAKVGFLIESTAAYSTLFDNCTCSGNASFDPLDSVGLYGKSSNYWTWINGQGTDNGTDFRLGSASNRGQMVIDGHRSERSRRFVIDDNSTIRDATVDGSSLYVRSVTWDGRVPNPTEYMLDADVDILMVEAVQFNSGDLDRGTNILGGTVSQVFAYTEDSLKGLARRNNSGGVLGWSSGGGQLVNYESPPGPDSERQTLTLPKTTFAAGETSTISWPFTHSPSSDTFTADASTDLLTSAGNHGLVNRYYSVRFTTTGTLPAGLSEKTVYWVLFQSSTTFKVSTTENGTPVDITDAGSGTHTWVRHNLLPSFSLAFDWTPSALGAASGYANRHGIVKITGVEMLGQAGDLALSIGGSPLVMSVQYDSGSALSVPSLTLADPGWTTGTPYRVVFVYDAEERIYQLIARVGYGSVGKAGGINNTGTLGADDGELRPTGERIPIYTDAPEIVIGGGLFEGTIANGSWWDRALVDSEVEAEVLGGREATAIVAT